MQTTVKKKQGIISKISIDKKARLLLLKFHKIFAINFDARENFQVKKNTGSNIFLFHFHTTESKNRWLKRKKKYGQFKSSKLSSFVRNF